MSYFSVDKASTLSQCERGAAIHVIGICGVAMAQIAIELTKLGFSVSGSDKEYYDPMKSLLERSQITLLSGYDAAHITSEIDFVVIGNSIRRDNPEVAAV